MSFVRGLGCDAVRHHALCAQEDPAHLQSLVSLALFLQHSEPEEAAVLFARAIDGGAAEDPNFAGVPWGRHHSSILGRGHPFQPHAAHTSDPGIPLSPTELRIPHPPPAAQVPWPDAFCVWPRLPEQRSPLTPPVSRRPPESLDLVLMDDAGEPTRAIFSISASSSDSASTTLMRSVEGSRCVTPSAAMENPAVLTRTGGYTCAPQAKNNSLKPQKQ